MSDRPLLTKELDSHSFREYYYLKEELVEFCRGNGIPASGGKQELTERIAVFLDTGKIEAPKKSCRRIKPDTPADITRADLIEENFVCSEKHRAFFKREIGTGFSFNVSFQKWLKENPGRTYDDAIAAYHRILEEKKQGVSEIGSQFEYNTYIRDFFAANEGRSLKDAIRCWKYKKSLKGHNRYEPSDLRALEK